MISRLPDLCQLSVVIEKGASLPSVVLPNLTNLAINWNHDSDLFWMFHGATFGKLEVITFNSTFKPTNDFRSICDFLETFERVMLAVSAQNTLSEFYFHTSCSCNPNYSSLLPFTQLRYLIIGSSCGDGCTSRVDDDIITNLTQVMPELEILLLGDMPCHEILTGVTVKVLVVLAHHCQNLAVLCVHFQVLSLTTLPVVIPIARSTAPQRDCALMELQVGDIPVPEASALVVAMTLVQIFPHIEDVVYLDESWEEVAEMFSLSINIINCSSKEHPCSVTQRNFHNTFPDATPEDGG